jgi:16S rRNA (uracil1498-N3)-methyltransferase
MPAPRFFVDLPLAPGARVQLPPAVAHHAFRVLRLAETDVVTLFNGHGGEFDAALGSVQRGDALLRDHRAVERESQLDLALVQALVATEKLDWIVEKATELGAARVLLLPAERSVVRLTGERLERRLAHLRNVARAACEQCGRNRVPQVHAVGSLAEAAAAAPPAAQRLVLAPDATQVPMSRAGAFVLAVGPEGGFTPAELSAARAAGYGLTSLGPRVLRTETAGLAALAALQALHGDFAGRGVT